MEMRNRLNVVEARHVRRSLPSAFFAIALLASCAGSGSPLSFESQRQVQNASSSGGTLLYVSDWHGGRILLFDYPAGTPAGAIADPHFPLGLCSDPKGNVWVVNFGAGYDQILEFAHGGTMPIATLSDPGESPRGCSYDSTSGNLAVANTNPSNGNVVIYPNATGSPQPYKPLLSYPFACAYDGTGNLFVDGYHLQSGDRFALSVLPRGSSQFLRVKVPSGIGLPGNVQWDGLDLAVGDYQSPGTVYRLKISKNLKNATLDGTVTLAGPVVRSPEGVQFWIGGGALIMPFATKKYADLLGIWNYPAGGNHIDAWRGFGSAEFYGVTLSAPPSR
jgi:hypothetical protein